MEMWGKLLLTEVVGSCAVNQRHTVPVSRTVCKTHFTGFCRKGKYP